MLDRYDRPILENNHQAYNDIFDKKNIKFIKQYKTPIFKELKINEMRDVVFIQHVWTYGDRYYKLSEKYLGDARDWWIIARLNNKPTEAHIKLGDIIYVPNNLSIFLKYL